MTSNHGTKRGPTRNDLKMGETLLYPNLMGATIDSLVEETYKTGQQVSIIVNYSPRETQFLFSLTLKTGPVIEAN